MRLLFSFLAVVVFMAGIASAGTYITPAVGSEDLVKTFSSVSDITNIRIAHATDGSNGYLIYSVGEHPNSIILTVPKAKYKVDGASTTVVHISDTGVQTLQIVSVTQKAGEVDIVLNMSSNCIGCFTGRTTITRTGMTNGSWDNRTNALNASLVTATFSNPPINQSLYYGITWNEATDVYTRTGLTAGQTLGVTLPSNYLPIQSLIHRVLMTDAGVKTYLSDTNTSQYVNGTTADIVSGNSGQVLTEIPLFYSKHTYTGSTHEWDISQYNLTGFSIDQSFYANGAYRPFIYIGAYEGSMWDATTSALVASGSITSNMYAAGDKLSSLSGTYPKTNELRSEYRSMAASRGSGWRQQSWDMVSAVQLLYLTEYANFNSQATIGMGRTELSGRGWSADSYIGQTGKSNAKGNGTFSVGGNTNDAYMTYRGIENFYGNVWKFVDGININDHVPYISNTDTQFADDTATNYVSAGVTMGAGSGFIATLSNSGRGFFPASVGGSSSTKVPDYYYQAAGWRVALLGGRADNGAYAGAFSLFATYASSDFAVDLGGRLAYIPNDVYVENTNTTVWIQPEGQSPSAVNTSNASSIIVNYVPNAPIQNTQFFSTNSPFNLTYTIYFTQNTSTEYEGSENGWYHYNSTLALSENVTNGSITLTITDDTFLNAQYKGSATLLTNNPNATLQANGIYLNVTLGVTNTSNHYYNVSIPYNNAPITTIEQTLNFTDIKTVRINTTATDSENNSLSCYVTLNGNTLTSCTQNDFGLLSPGYYTLWFNVTEQATTDSQWVNKSATVNVSLYVAPTPTPTATATPGNETITTEQYNELLDRIDTSGSTGFLGGIVGGAVVIGYLRRKRKE